MWIGQSSGGKGTLNGKIHPQTVDLDDTSCFRGNDTGIFDYVPDPW